jgi:hypothetical protein
VSLTIFLGLDLQTKDQSSNKSSKSRSSQPKHNPKEDVLWQWTVNTCREVLLAGPPQGLSAPLILKLTPHPNYLSSRVKTKGAK